MIKCPICAENTKVTKLSCQECKTSYEGTFEMPRLARLDRDLRALAEEFLLSGGNLKDLARSKNISYPTLRKQIDRLMDRIRALKAEDEKRIGDILADIEQGRMSGEEGLRLMREINGEL